MRVDRDDLNKDLRNCGRFYVIPSAGPALVIGGPRLSIESVVSFVNINILSVLGTPAYARILQQRAFLYNGPEETPCLKNMFDLNIGDTVLVSTSTKDSNGQTSTAHVTYSVAFPFCLEIGAGAQSSEMGTLIVEKSIVAGSAKESVRCDIFGQNDTGDVIVKTK